MNVASKDHIPVLIHNIQTELQVLMYNYSFNNTSQHDHPQRGLHGGHDDDDLGLPPYEILNGSYPWHNDSYTYVVPRISAEIQIALYTLIFLLAVVGNLLVLITLFQNKRMRTVTNVFLLNLALSDLLLAVFCMPFTLVPVLLRNFIFGAAMCVLLRYLQAVSVGVSCFTLVAISLERYFAICRPLHSRSWQTLSHAYRCIGVCWLLAAILMTPVAVFQKHTPLPNKAYSCREMWPDPRLARAYTVLLDLALLVLPVLLMSLAYVNVVHALVFDVRSPSFKDETPEPEEETPPPIEKAPKGVLANYRTIELRLLGRDSVRSISSVSSAEETSLSRSGTVASGTTSPSRAPPSRTALLNEVSSASNHVNNSATSKNHHHHHHNNKRSARHQNRIRHSNPRKIRENKIRVIRMLFVVVLEFFMCWTPLYVIQTWMVFDTESAYEVVTPLTKTLFHLLSYVSSCCNPITYCFMNKKFREGFVRVFTCRKPPPPLKERQRGQQLMMLHDSRRFNERQNVMTSINSANNMVIGANSIRQFDFDNNFSTIEEASAEDGSQS